MDISSAIKQRHSVRAFTDKTVTRQQIEQILSVASHSPSGANTQPWQVAVVIGEMKKTVENQLQSAFSTGEKAKLDYHYYPTNWQAPYKARRTACGLQLYSALNINRDDMARRQAQWAANYRAFDAPAMLFFFIDPSLETGSYLDYGLFLQSIMLAAMAEGLATCPQAALAEYPQIVKSCLGYSEEAILICGMALGYEDTTADVNHYRTPRETVASFTHFFD